MPCVKSHDTVCPEESRSPKRMKRDHQHMDVKTAVGTPTVAGSKPPASAEGRPTSGRSAPPPSTADADERRTLQREVKAARAALKVEHQRLTELQLRNAALQTENKDVHQKLKAATLLLAECPSRKEVALLQEQVLSAQQEAAAEHQQRQLEVEELSQQLTASQKLVDEGHQMRLRLEQALQDRMAEGASALAAAVEQHREVLQLIDSERARRALHVNQLRALKADFADQQTALQDAEDSAAKWRGLCRALEKEVKSLTLELELADLANTSLQARCRD